MLFKSFDNGGLYGVWIKVKDKKDTGRIVLYMFNERYYMGSVK
ncbi:14862_t:CDS:1, partial [Gigaspora margarita]